MKKIIFSILCLVSTTLIACNHEEIPVNPNDLPKAAQSFIQKYFAKSTIAIAIKDGNEYEVKFANGYEIDFDKNGEWKDVDCQMTAIPQGIVPTTIDTYVKNNFAQNFIVKISRDRHGYDVELNNDLDLEFDSNGKFIRIDD